MNLQTETLLLDMLNVLAAISYSGVTNAVDKAELDDTIAWFKERFAQIQTNPETHNQLN